MADVTGEQLRELRRAAEAVADAVEEAVVVAAADLSAVYAANPAYESVYGQSVERLYDEPRSFLDAVAEADRPRFEAALEAAVDAVGDGATATDDPLHEGDYRLDADGGAERVRVRVQAVSAEEGTPRLLLVTDPLDCADRTDAPVFEGVGDGLVVHDPDTGEILDANGAFCEMNGYSRAELVGESIDVVTATDEGYSLEDARARIRRARTEGTQRFEWRNRRKDGTTFPVEVSLELLEHDGEERVFASVRDVTERVRRRREREEERTKYTRLVEQSHDGIVIVQEREYVFVNDRFCEMLGRDRDDLLGSPLDEVMTPEYRDVVRERYRQRIEGESPESNYDVQLRTADGDVVDAELTVSRITHEGEPATLANFRDITERKRTERELRQLTEEYRTVTENAQDAIFLLDVVEERNGQDGERTNDRKRTDDGERTDDDDVSFVFRRLNSAHEKTTGLSTETLRGQTPREAFGEELGAEVEANYRRCFERRETITYEEELDLPAGTATWQTKLSPVIIDGEVTQIVGVARDITERKRLEEELQRRQRQFSLIADHIDEIIYLATADFSEILYVNDAYREIYGTSPSELVEEPTSFVDVAHPDDRDRYERDIERIVADIEAGDAEEAYDGEYRLRRDGETRHVHVTRFPVENDDGTIDRVVGRVQDVTERRELERTYQDIFENVSDGLVVHDPDTGEIVDVNEQYCELTGYSREELVGSDVGIVMSDDPDSAYSVAEAERMIDAARAEGPQLFEWRGERKDGTPFEADISLAVVEVEGRERVLASVRDVTERKQREREYEQIFDGVNDIISVHDPETGEILEVNETYVEESGYDEATIVDLGVGGLTADVEGYDEARSRELIREVAEAGEPVTVEWPVETADGEQRWYEVETTPAEIGGQQRVLGISRDITERRRHQRTMDALHESTERIQEAETTQAVCEAAVAAMEEVLELSLPAVWLRRGEGEEAVLEPVAASDAAWAFAGGPGPLEPGTFEYELFESGETAVYDPTERWERTSLSHALMVPVGNHGVIGAADPEVEEFEDATVDAARILARHTTTALDRVERAEQRRESERRMSAILDRIDEAIFLTDKVDLGSDESGSVYVGAGYEAVFGRSYEHLAADDTEEFVDLLHPEDRDGYRQQLTEQAADIEAGDPDDRYAHEYRIQHPTDGVRWIHSDFYPTEWHDGSYRLVVVSRDITERKERRSTLETFHEATRELTETGSRKEASQHAVDAAERVLGFPLVSVHLYDDEAGSLRPVGETDRLRELLDFLPSFEPGDSLPWQVFVDGEAVRLSEDTEKDVYGRGVSDPDLVLPLGPHGVMLVGTPAETFDAERVELAQILAATLEAALNHVQGQRRLERREAELEEHRERVTRLERLNTVIREIEQATVEKTDREAIETAVCEQLTTVDSYRIAWIADANTAGDALVARAVDGDEAGYVDTLAVDLGGTGLDRHPAAEAYETGEVQMVRNLATNPAAGSWRKPALREGYQAITSVPLRYDEAVYGVLTIVADDPNAFEERTAAILGELGRSVGYALSVLERRDALESDTTTELEFEVDDDDLLFVDLADDLDAAVTLERTVRRTGGSFGAFYTVEGVDPERALEAVREAPGVAEATLVSEDPNEEAGLVEAVSDSWFGGVFATYGAVVRTATADEGGGQLVVEAPRAADIRSLVDAFQGRYPDSELLAQRTRERAVQTLLELQDILSEQLTPRQLEALETAYSAGYFDWPRGSSGEEVAELLGVTQPTFNKHLRTAERKTFSMLLNREYPE